MNTTTTFDLVTRAEIAAMLRISVRGVGNLSRNGKLPPPVFVVGKQERYDRAEVLAACRAAAAARV